MNFAFIRFFFLLLCIFFASLFTLSFKSEGFSLASLGIGVLGGTIFASICIFLDSVFKKFNLRSFNTVWLGLFFGFLLGQAVLLMYNALVDAVPLPINPEISAAIKVAIFLFTAYFGIILTERASEDFAFSIPFILLNSSQKKKKDILLDTSILSDPRLIDLANSGLLDERLVMPRFALNEIVHQTDIGDEISKNKARRCLDTLKKLESIEGFDLRFSELDFPDAKDPQTKLVKLARHLEANLLTSDMSKIQQSELEGLKIININFLSQALKPLATAGEQILIKIQRYGKEPRQGIGYLDDGTMVVVNGGAEYIGETIKAVVLSVKHTSSGRMIFCNAVDDAFNPLDKTNREPQDLESNPFESYNV